MNRPLTSRLDGLRARLRGLWLAAGLFRLFAEVAAFLVLQFALDRLLFLPAGARRFVLAVALVAFAWRFFVLVLRPQSRRVGPMDMARAVERRHAAELDGALASVVEFEGREGALPADVSPGLLALFKQQVEAKGARLDFATIFDFTLLKRLGLADAALLALIVGFSVLRGAEAGIFFARLFGADVDWPRRTHLSLDVMAGDSPNFRVERDADGRALRVLVARGGRLPIQVTARGAVPDEVLLVVSEKGRAGKEEVRMAPREGAVGEFIYLFRNAVRPMELAAEGGDDAGHGPPLEVDVLPPPAVDKLVATLTPPAYTRRPPTREERQEFAVPAGTRLDLEILTAGDVADGTLTLHSDPGTARPLERDAANAALFRATLVAEDSGTFNLHLTGKSGFKNLQPLDYPLTVLADRKPTLEIARPAVSDLEVTQRGVVPLRVLVDDDYGVTRVELACMRFGEKEAKTFLLQGAGSERPDELPAVGEPTALDLVLDFATIEFPHGGAPAKAADGDTINYVFTVQDNREAPPGTRVPNETMSVGRRIDVVTEAEKLRKLADRQLRVKQSVAAAKKSQEERLQGLVALLAGQGEDEIKPRELTSLEVEQGRVVNSARQISRELGDVTQEFILNRLDPATTADRALAFLLGKLEASHAGPVFDYRPWQELAAAHAAGDFGELNQLGILIAMLDLALQASETHAQKALETLRGARVSGRGEDRIGLLKAATEAQKKVIDCYAQLLAKMEEWEDYQEILELWRGLVNDQGEINQHVRTGAKPPDGDTKK